MSVQTKDYLKTRFETGDKPSAQDFIDLFDSLVGKLEPVESNAWQPPSSPVYMSTGQEITCTHPTIVNELYTLSISQEIPGVGGNTNISIDFAPGAEGNYIQENNSKTEFYDGVVRLEQSPSSVLTDYTNITNQHNSLTTTNGSGTISYIFDGSTATRCDVTGVRNGVGYAQWGYAIPRRVGTIKIATANQRGYNLNATLFISASNDGVNFTTLQTYASPTTNGPSDLLTYNIDLANQGKFLYYRFNFYMMDNTAGNTCMFNDMYVYENAVYPVDKGYYVTTSDNSHFGFSQASKIDSVTITNSQPTNTSIKCLVSFDGRVTWKTYNGSAWVASSLDSISVDGCTVVEVQNGLSNYIKSSESFLDFAFLLTTTAMSVTPSVDQVTIVYTDNSHYEIATAGSYTSTADFGVKRVDPNTTLVKRLNTNPGKVFITMTIG